MRVVPAQAVLRTVVSRLVCRRMLRFTLFGIPVSVQPWFWLVLALLSGRFEANSPEGLLHLLIFIAAGFISILVHELGHALTAKAFGARVHIVLEALGGYAAYSGVHLSRGKSFLVTLAGPVVQIVLGVSSYLLYVFFPPNNNYGADLLLVLSIISIFWALLNLLPIFPLDGGHLLDAVLGRHRIRVTLIVSIVTAVGGALALLVRKDFSLLPLFLISLAYQAFTMLRQMPR